MKAVEWKALAYRIGLSQLCHRAGVSRTIADRWSKGKNTPTLATIGKLEAALDAVEREREA